MQSPTYASSRLTRKNLKKLLLVAIVMALPHSRTEGGGKRENFKISKLLKDLTAAHAFYTVYTIHN